MGLPFASKKRAESAEKEAARRATERAALKARSSRKSDTDDEDPRRSKKFLSKTSAGSIGDGKKQAKDEFKKTSEVPHTLNSRMNKPVTIAAEGSPDDSPYALGSRGKVVLDERSTGTDETKDLSNSDSDQEHGEYGYDNSSSQQNARVLHRRSSFGGSINQRRMSAVGSGGHSRRVNISRRAGINGNPSSQRQGSSSLSHRGSSMHSRREEREHYRYGDQQEDYLSESMRSSSHQRRGRVRTVPSRGVSELSTSSHGRNTRRGDISSASSHRSPSSRNPCPSIKTSDSDYGYSDDDNSESDYSIVSGSNSGNETSYGYGDQPKERTGRRGSRHTNRRRGSHRNGPTRTESGSSHGPDYGHGENEEDMVHEGAGSKKHRVERRHSRRPSVSGRKARSASAGAQGRSHHASMSVSAPASGSGRVHRRSSRGRTAERWLDNQKPLTKEPVEAPRGVTRQKSLDQAMKLSLLGYDKSDTEQDC